MNPGASWSLLGAGEPNSAPRKHITIQNKCLLGSPGDSCGLARLLRRGATYRNIRRTQGNGRARPGRRRGPGGGREGASRGSSGRFFRGNSERSFGGILGVLWAWEGPECFQWVRKWLGNATQQQGPSDAPRRHRPPRGGETLRGACEDHWLSPSSLNVEFVLVSTFVIWLSTTLDALESVKAWATDDVSSTRTVPNAA